MLNVSVFLIHLLQCGLLFGGFFAQDGGVAAKFLICIVLSCFVLFLLKKLGKISLHFFYNTFTFALNMCVIFTCFVTFHDVKALMYTGGFLLAWLYAGERKLFIFKIISSILMAWIGARFLSLQFHASYFLEIRMFLIVYIPCTLFIYFTLVFLREKNFRLPAILLPSFLLVEITLITSLSIFSGENWHETKRILKTPFVKPVVLYAGEDKLAEVLRKNPTRVVYEDCGHKNLFLFQREKPYGIIKMNRDTGKALEVFNGAGVGDTAFMDCREQTFYFPAYHEHRILVFNAKNITQPVKRFSLPGNCQPDHVLVDGKNGKMFVGCDQGDLLILDKQSGRQADVIRKKVTMPRFYGEGHLLFQAEGMVYDYDYAHNDFEGLFRSEGHVHVDVDRQRNIIFANNPSGYVSFLEDIPQKGKDKVHLEHGSFFQGRHAWIEQKKETDRVYLEPITRYMCFDSKRKLLFITNYFTGYIYIIDTAGKKVLHKFYAGTRVHAMTFSYDHDKLYFASSQGVFYLDLSMLDGT